MKYAYCPKCGKQLVSLHDEVEDGIVAQDWWCDDCDFSMTTYDNVDKENVE